MILKLSVLNTINIKNRTRNRVVNIVGPKLSSHTPLRVFSMVFSCIGKSNKVWWRGLLTLRQSLNQSRVHIKNGDLLRKNKNKLSRYY